MQADIALLTRITILEETNLCSFSCKLLFLQICACVQSSKVWVINKPKHPTDTNLDIENAYKNHTVEMRIVQIVQVLKSRSCECIHDIISSTVAGG